MIKHTTTTGHSGVQNGFGLSLIPRLTELCLKIFGRASKPMAVPKWAAWTGLLMAETGARTVGCSQQSSGFLQILIINTHTEARLTEGSQDFLCLIQQGLFTAQPQTPEGSPVTELPLDKSGDFAPT